MDLSKLSPGQNAPKEINVVIEIPDGVPVKYEIDKESGALFVDRFNFVAMSHPANYGFIPGTRAADGDAVDVLVLSESPVVAGSVIPSRPIGLLAMEDEKGPDNKIIAVPLKKVDPFYAEIEDIADLPEIVRARIKHFFDRYKELEKGKWVKTGEFSGKDQAIEEIRKALA